MKLPVKTILLILFFLSGLTGLICESVYASYMRIWLGYAALAQNLVLIVYMCGMALGAWLASGYKGSPRRMLRLFGLAEILAGVWAITATPLFKGIDYLAVAYVFPQSFTLLTAFFRMAGAVIILLPPAVFFGFAFPLMLKTFVQHQQNRSVSVVYGVNALGGVIGVLLSGLYLTGTYSYGYILGSCGFVCLLSAFVSFVIAAKNTTSNQQPKVQDIQPEATKKYYAIAFVAGMAAFILQTAFLRMLSMVLGSSFRSFELMLAVYIGGITAGSLITARYKPRTVLKLAVWLAPLAGFAGLLMYNFSFDLMETGLRALTKTTEGWIAFNLWSIIVASALLFAPAFFFGMILPALLNLVHSRQQGKVYAFSSLGSAAGSVLALQLGFPLLGTWGTVVTGMSLMLIAATFMFKHKKARYNFIPAVMGLMLFVLFNTLVRPDILKVTSGVFRTGSSSSKSKVLYYKDGSSSSVSVTISNDENMTLGINGKPDAAIGLGDKPGPDEPVEILLAALPLSVSLNPEQVMVIGLGSGLTAHVALCDERVKNVDVVEIEPAVIEASRNFGHRVAKVYFDNRCKINTGDARTYMASGQKKYDLIISEPSNPWVDGMGGLFTREFFLKVKSHLAPKGIFTQWMHLYESDITLLSSVINALSPVFKDYTVYMADDGNILIMAGDSVSARRPGTAVFNYPELKQNLERIGIFSPEDISLHKLGSKSWLDSFFALSGIPGSGYNSDFRPVLETNAVKARFLETEVEGLDNVLNYLTPVFEPKAGLYAGISRYSYRFSAGYDFLKAFAVYNNVVNNSGAAFTDNIFGGNSGNGALRSAIHFPEMLDDPGFADAFHDELVNLYRFASRSETDTLWAILNKSLTEHKLSTETSQLLNFYSVTANGNPNQIISQGLKIISKQGFWSNKIMQYVEFQIFLSYMRDNRQKEAKVFWHSLCKNGIPESHFQLVSSLLNQHFIIPN